jgi:diguanylate cyclase (GGDEF)-like protein
MQAFCSRLSIAAPEVHDCNVVRLGTPLEQVLEQIDLAGPAYLLVVDDSGTPAGIISTEDLLLRISSSDGMERLKWSSRPVESILSVLLSMPHSGDGQVITDAASVADLDCTAFHHNGRLHAVATDDDLLVSWRSLEPFLARAARDSVTGLTTRAGFLRTFDCELARARRARKPMSVIMLDVDHFKQVNDLAGHSTGDAVLNLIAAAVCTSVRSYDLVARFAGDEFVALCGDCVPEQVHIPIARIQRAIETLPLPDSFPLPSLTLSIGAASVTTVTGSLTCEHLLERADDCLYAAKRHGRDCAFYVNAGSPESQPALVSTLRAVGTSEIPAALSRQPRSRAEVSPTV